MKIQWHDSISELSKDQWDSMDNTRYPFTRFAFLEALESSGSVSQQTGWQPHHLSVKDSHDNCIAVMPMYKKIHSFGEYVFDWAWADAYERNGFPYYPKLLNAIPFTPSTGPRILFSDTLDASDQSATLEFISQSIKDFLEPQEMSSWHCLFLEYSSAEALESQDFLLRKGCQFHWFNKSYACFDDFLDRLASRKRKSIKRERRKVKEQSISLKRLMGNEISEELCEAFYQFYQNTYWLRGQKGYLSLAFFKKILQDMPEQIMMNMAYFENKPVAAALYLFNDQCLFGRYWGCSENFDNLHFETCYYQGIEYCIENNIQRFDPGAQGEHKVPRGFEPIETWSAHWIVHPGFRDAISRFLDEETLSINQYIEDAKTLLPFKSS